MTQEIMTTANQADRILATAIPDETAFRGALQAIRKFQAIVQSELIDGTDYGIIPGTTKPTMLKPGAEKIAKILGLADEYIILDKAEDWGKPLFRYLIKCQLRHLVSGLVVSEGLGECNSMEAKYRWRDTKPKCPKCGAEAIIKGKAEWGGGWLCYVKKGGCGTKWPDGATEIEGQKVGRIENDDIYSQVNTILKMGKKRALVDAALSAGRLSNIFTQDLDDLPLPQEDKPQIQPVKHPPKPTTPGQAMKETTPPNPAPPKAEAAPRASSEAGKATDWPADAKDVPVPYNAQGRWDTYRKETQPFADDVTICKVIKLSTGLDMPVDTEGKPIMWKPPEGFTEAHMAAMEKRLQDIKNKRAVK